jgi:ABC-type antimicrobial peptide transport system permease subunit
MFLIEAALIGLGGGLIGVGLSYLFSLGMNAVISPIFFPGGGKMSVTPLWLPLAALAFATGVGVLSGYSPARRAMNLSALESLKNE